MTSLNDNQVEAVRRLVSAADVYRTRGGDRVNLGWDDYRALAALFKRMNEAVKSKSFTDEAVFKKDLGVLVTLADQSRKLNLFTWDEGASIADAVEVFRPRNPEQAPPAPPAATVEPVTEYTLALDEEENKKPEVPERNNNLS